MSELNPKLRQVLHAGVEEWLRLYRNDRPNAIELSKIASSYESVLPHGTSPVGLRAAMNEAMKRTRFMPTPAELLNCLAAEPPEQPTAKPEALERARTLMEREPLSCGHVITGPLEEISRWEPSNPNWPEVKEFVSKLHEVSQSPKTPNVRQEDSMRRNPRPRQRGATG